MLSGANPGLLSVHCDIVARDLYSVRAAEVWDLEFELDENLHFEERAWDSGRQKVLQGHIEREGDKNDPHFGSSCSNRCLQIGANHRPDPVDLSGLDKFIHRDFPSIPS